MKQLPPQKNIKSRVQKHIHKYKDRLIRLDDRQIFWTDECASPLEPLYRQDRDIYIKALDEIMCDIRADVDTRIAAFNLYDLVWFVEKDDRGDITRRMRGAFEKIICEGDGDARRTILCYLHKICSGSDDELLLKAYAAAKAHNNSTFYVITNILRRLDLEESIPEAKEALYVNFGYGMNHMSTFEEKYERIKNTYGRRAKSFLLGRYVDVVEKGDVSTTVKITKHLFKSPYSFEENKRNMASYLRQVPALWNILPKEVTKYG